MLEVFLDPLLGESGLPLGFFFGFATLSSPTNPFAANCWACAVGTIAGGAAGATGGAVRQLLFKGERQIQEA